MELLDDLLGLLEGIVDDKETLQGIIDSEGLEVLYDEIDPDAFPTMESYLSYFGELQKKKKKLEILLLFLQRKIRNQIHKLLKWKELDLRILHQQQLMFLK